MTVAARALYLQHLVSVFCGLSATFARLADPAAPAAAPDAAFSLAAMSSCDMVRKATSTFVAVFADVSKKEMPSFSPKRAAVSSATCFRSTKSA